MKKHLMVMSNGHELSIKNDNFKLMGTVYVIFHGSSPLNYAMKKIEGHGCSH